MSNKLTENELNTHKRKKHTMNNFSENLNKLLNDAKNSSKKGKSSTVEKIKLAEFYDRAYFTLKDRIEDKRVLAAVVESLGKESYGYSDKDISLIGEFSNFVSDRNFNPQNINYSNTTDSRKIITRFVSLFYGSTRKYYSSAAFKEVTKFLDARNEISTAIYDDIIEYMIPIIDIRKVTKESFIAILYYFLAEHIKQPNLFGRFYENWILHRIMKPFAQPTMDKKELGLTAAQYKEYIQLFTE
jgi:hypothetical protein